MLCLTCLLQCFSSLSQSTRRTSDGAKIDILYDNQQILPPLLLPLFTTSKEVSFILRAVEQSSDIGTVGVEEQQRDEAKEEHQPPVAIATQGRIEGKEESSHHRTHRDVVSEGDNHKEGRKGERDASNGEGKHRAYECCDTLATPESCKNGEHMTHNGHQAETHLQIEPRGRVGY